MGLERWVRPEFELDHYHTCIECGYVPGAVCEICGDTGTCPQDVHRFQHGDFALGTTNCRVLELKVAPLGVRKGILLSHGG